jgi:hypothetical protein
VRRRTTPHVDEDPNKEYEARSIATPVFCSKNDLNPEFDPVETFSIFIPGNLSACRLLLSTTTMMSEECCMMMLASPSPTSLIDK